MDRGAILHAARLARQFQWAAHACAKPDGTVEGKGSLRAMQRDARALAEALAALGVDVEAHLAEGMAPQSLLPPPSGHRR